MQEEPETEEAASQENVKAHQAEVYTCINSVPEMKERLLEMKAVVQQKTVEVAQLREQFAAQGDMLDATTRKFDENKHKMQKEIEQLHKTVRLFFFFSCIR